MKIEVNHEKYLQEIIKEIISCRFQDKYTYMTHIAAFAALDVSHDLLKLSNQTCSFEESMQITIKPEHYKDAWDKYLKKAYNFFKHADNKNKIAETVTIEFNPRMNDMLIFYLMKNLRVLYANNYTCIEMEIYKLWFAITHPELIDRKLFEEDLQVNIDELISFNNTQTEAQKAKVGKHLLNVSYKYNITNLNSLIRKFQSLNIYEIADLT